MMRSAMMFPEQRKTPDPARIAGIATAVVINLAIFAVLMRTPTMSPPVPDTDTSNPVIIIDPPPPPLVEPPKVLKVLKQPLQPPRPVPLKIDVPIPKPPVVTIDRTPMSTQQVVAKVDQGPVANDPGPVKTIQEASLSPLVAPPPTYPIEAVRDNITGKVELELLVGVDGHVLKVTIIRSSGDHRLDAAAREDVLQNWRFQPAMENGVAVQAIGRLPVVFSLGAQ